MFSFVPIDRLLVSRDYPSSCFFIIEFSRACALFNFNFYRLYTWHFTEWWRLLAIGYGLLWGVKGDFLINNCLLCLYISEKSCTFEGHRPRSHAHEPTSSSGWACETKIALRLKLAALLPLPTNSQICGIPLSTFAKCWTYFSVARNYFQKSATPSESVSLPTLMQASFQRVAEKLIQIDKIYYFWK